MKLDLDAPRVKTIEVFPKNPVDRRASARSSRSRVARDLRRRRRPRRDRRGVPRERATPRSRPSTRPASSTAVRRGEATDARPLRGGLRRHARSSSWATAPASPGSSGRPTTTSTSWSTRSCKRVKMLPSDLCTRRRVRPPRLPRPDRPAADGRGGPGVPRRHAPTQGEARRADRQARRQRRRSSSTGRTSGPTCCRSTASSSATRGPTAFRNWIREAVADEHAVRQVRLRDPDRAAARTCENPPAAYFKMLRDARRGDGEHDAPVPGRPLQLQQVPRPSVRALDAGPVLPAGRVLRAGRPQAEDPKYKGQKIGGTAVEGAKPLVESHRRRARPARSSTTAPARSRRRSSRSRSRRHADGRRAAPRASSPSGSRRRTTRTSPRATSTASGATCSASASSSRSTTSAPATRRPTRSCSTA